MKLNRIEKIAIWCIIVLALAIWVNSRWRAWFHNAEEAGYYVALTPDRVTLTPGENFMTQRTVSWRCGKKYETSYLRLVHDGDTTTINAAGKAVIAYDKKDEFYAAHINGLKDSIYRYQVVTGNKASQWFTLRMPKPNTNTRKFIYFGDVQDTIGGTSKQIFDNLYQRYPNADFWACGGDLIEHATDEYWNYLYQSTDSILAKMPLINATGNHDYLKLLYQLINPRWVNAFVYPSNGAKTAIGKSYFIDLPNLRMIVLDTNGIQDSFTLTSQYVWLRRILHTSGNKWKVVMMHHPIYSVRKGRDNTMIRNTFLPLIKKYGVQLVLEGHDHNYARYIPNKGTTPVFLISYMSPKSYTRIKPYKGMKVIQERRFYQVIDYTPKTMKIRAYDAMSDSLVDAINITRR
jgi:3',5'-cyclic AMP phosphodiesterase CpdA